MSFETEDEMIRLPNPPTKKWVKFQDWDEEALQFREATAPAAAAAALPPRNLSSSQLSTSASSDSSFGSVGDGCVRRPPAGGSIHKKPAAAAARGPVDFSASFGGTDKAGGAAALRSAWQPPAALSRYK